MKTYTVKGHQIVGKITKSGYSRKAVVFENNIVNDLKKLGIIRDDIEVLTDAVGNKNIPAELQFWVAGHYCRFTYSMTKRFIDNLYIISKLVELEVKEVLDEKKDIHEFLNVFKETGERKEIVKELIEAKKTLGLDEKEEDVEVINQAYKKLARKAHPDLGGDMQEFQKINKAHKLIKKEMGL